MHKKYVLKGYGGVLVLTGMGNHHLDWTGFHYWLLPIPWHTDAFGKCVRELTAVEKEAFGSDYSMVQHETGGLDLPKWRFGIQAWLCRSPLGQLLGSELLKKHGDPTHCFSSYYCPATQPPYYIQAPLPLGLPSFEFEFHWIGKQGYDNGQDGKALKAALAFEDTIIRGYAEELGNDGWVAADFAAANGFGNLGAAIRFLFIA